MNTRPLTKAEVLYTYHNNDEIAMKAGLIGCFRVDFGDSGKEFVSTWFDYIGTKRYPDFRARFDEVLIAARENKGFLSSRNALKAFCNNSANVFTIDSGHEYGVRSDEKKYAFLMRFDTNGSEFDVYCYCYVKELLDKHLDNAKRGISICSAKDNYKELFKLDDGDQIIIESKSGKEQKESLRYICRYIDDTHFALGNNIYHIDQFADLVNSLNYAVIPLRASLPDRAYVFIETNPDIGIVVKGEIGYYRTEITVPTRDERRAMVDELNEKLGVTKAQAEAMKSGSMYGWHVPSADPRSYDEAGNLL